MRRILCLAILSASLVLAGCASSPFRFLQGAPSEPRKIANYVQTEKQVPLKVGVTADGKDVIAYATERTYTAGSNETVEQLSFMQRVGRWIGGLTGGAIIFIIVSLVFFGGAPIIWAMKKYYTVKNSLKKVVEGVDELAEKDKEAQDQLKTSLSMKMDTNEKKLIQKIKNT